MEDFLLKEFNVLCLRMICDKPGHYMVKASPIYLNPNKELTFQQETTIDGKKVCNLLIFEPGKQVTEHEVDTVYRTACGMFDCVYRERTWASLLKELFYNYDNYALNGKIFEWWIQESVDDYILFNGRFRSIVSAVLDGVLGSLPGLIKKPL